MFAPDGNNKHQIQVTHEKAVAYCNKIKRSKLPKQAKWAALTTVLEPKILYPLMACSSDTLDFSRIDRTLSTAKCHALGLNGHFPWAVLHGHMHLGGMAIPTAISKTTTT
jgi:hypothetical protein